MATMVPQLHVGAGTCTGGVTVFPVWTAVRGVHPRSRTAPGLSLKRSVETRGRALPSPGNQASRGSGKGAARRDAPETYQHLVATG